ncbi:cyclopentanone 1,2-monooxygenase [Sclerotinia borealis F-4128]|uniref:Cyclopentanone 1,2-monooxygenase n=1 Tax=Sclerotinia borealis (strain F-4128) TaxID=1432307 RepID=W9CSZ7_SCLBF|nr:cyclopentanone 1,2-monooxygenase [Sclerotinia borealis F-4128]
MSALENLDALVVGAGFAGLYQLHSLRKLGYNCKVVELGGGVGGVWYWNNYPGARVDIHVPLYEYGFGGLYKDFTWTERFPERSELLRYFDYVDKKLDLSKDIVLNTGVTHAKFDIKASRWNVTLTTGEVCDCKFLILCTGALTKLFVPDFEGRWPQEGVNTAVSHLTVFQRTPNICLPMQQRPLIEIEQNTSKANGTYDEIYKTRPKYHAGLDYDFIQRNCIEDSPDKRRETFEQLYSDGGFRPWLGTYKDILFNQESNDAAYSFWAERCRERITDPKKKDLLAPLLENQIHTFGTKRPSLEQNFYEVCNQENVDIIDILANPIDTFTETGICMENGEEYHFDTIVLATGYDALTGGFTGIDIVGTDGRSIAEKWKDGIKTYLGMTMVNFPNLFMTYGVQAPSTFANGPVMSEIQGTFITRTIHHLNTCDPPICTIEPTHLSEESWHRKIIDLAAPSLFARTKSWYMGSNIPGKKIEMGGYMGGVPAFSRELEGAMEGGMEGEKWRDAWVLDGYLEGGVGGEV